MSGAITVVICTYNRAGVLPRAIDSVLAQVGADFELLVVDDGSTDGTGEVIEGYDDERLRGVSRPNGGLSAARNTGIAEASGDFVIFLDDDDRVDPCWLATLSAHIDADVGIVSCGCRWEDPDGNFLAERLPEPHPAFPEVEGVFLAGTFAVRRDLYRAVGGYAEAIPTSHQTELTLRLVPELRRRGLRVAPVREVLVTIESRAAPDRPLSQPAELLIGAEYLIEHHGDTLSEVPKVLADYHAVAGVSAVQIGEGSTGRRHLWAACRAAGPQPKHVARLAVACVPPIARRVWGRHVRGRQ